MKTLLTFLAIGIFAFASAQEEQKVYLDSAFVETSEAEHVYYRIVENSGQNGKYVFKNYFKSGKLQMEGLSSISEYFKGIGISTVYHENGNKSEVINYKDGTRFGRFESYYPNGNLELEGDYTMVDEAEKQLKLEVLNYFSPDKVQTVTNGEGTMHYDNPNVRESGTISKGAKTGNWTGNDKRMKLTFSETYKKGKLISGESTDGLTTYRYEEVEERPTFKSGLSAFYKYIAKNYKTPDSELSGRIILTFVVNKDGTLADIRCRRGISPEHDAEAVRVLSESPDWVAGKFRGKPARVAYSLPIQIRAAE